MRPRRATAAEGHPRRVRLTDAALSGDRPARPDVDGKWTSPRPGAGPAFADAERNQCRWPCTDSIAGASVQGQVALGPRHDDGILESSGWRARSSGPASRTFRLNRHDGRAIVRASEQAPLLCPPRELACSCEVPAAASGDMEAFMRTRKTPPMKSLSRFLSKAPTSMGLVANVSACVWLFIGGLTLAASSSGCETAPTQPPTVEAPGRVNLGQAFACGPDITCDRSTQYCSVFSGGPVGVPRNYACAALPDNCLSKPSCACLPERLGCACSETGGGITVTCTAP